MEKKLMFPDIPFDDLSWLSAHANVFSGIKRGVERESLRVDKFGRLSNSLHPKIFGSPLTHRWITTDFAETLLEFITPIEDDVDRTFILLRDIHRYVSINLKEERLWSMSMPCSITDIDSVKLAQYGKSNVGKMKTLYREGLKNRYGTIMQMISGLHYNFSFPISFWKKYIRIQKEKNEKKKISEGYLQLVRNYYRFGWIIPYLFGSSPGLCHSFLKNRKIDLPLKKTSSGLAYLPYATSLRLSEVGYTSLLQQKKINMNLNYFPKYINKIRLATRTISSRYRKIGKYGQLNSNILQVEDELYEPIRLKQIKRYNESLSDVLIQSGVGYIEIRSVDINPFSPVGFKKEQAHFLDLFLIWCILAESPKMDNHELLLIRNNWNRVLLKGRKPGLMLSFGQNSQKKSLFSIGMMLFQELQRIAEILDKNNGSRLYQDICEELLLKIYFPELTVSAIILDKLIRYGFHDYGLFLSEQYAKLLKSESLQILDEKAFEQERIRSIKNQKEMEEKDSRNLEKSLSF